MIEDIDHSDLFKDLSLKRIFSFQNSKNLQLFLLLKTRCNHIFFKRVQEKKDLSRPGYKTIARIDNPVVTNGEYADVRR